MIFNRFGVCFLLGNVAGLLCKYTPIDKKMRRVEFSAVSLSRNPVPNQKSDVKHYLE
ncbi:hypothetical protein HMPREF0454_02441 [Hafnia alvei ATCC 51873]|uniref:Uncharacterized protein n=1 Tax=Hafnia alvei ATCC 51873 TaxID=1002364 RepID=G9Y768_HAFAL|nr:hypothetical protein HMPREF0454_02441 [Hafnia alvei ATCC 51873]